MYEIKKNRQKKLILWLKSQSTISNYWLNVSRLLGFISGLLIVSQAWLIANILQYVIIEKISRTKLLLSLSILTGVFFLRTYITWIRERVGFYIGQTICHEIRRKILDKIQQAGPTWIYGKPIGSWVTLVIEHIEDIHNYYARYLPQISLAIYLPTIIIVAVFWVNRISAIILMFTAPLIPLFTMIIGIGAADAHRRNFVSLSRLSGYFLDRLRGIETLRLFYYGNNEIKNIRQVSEDFRKKTMKVLRLAFVSSGVMEFFTSFSMALIAVYFGLFYLGELNFLSQNNIETKLSSGFLVLILATEFFQPLKDLSTFYHAKSQAIGAADSLEKFLNISITFPEHGDVKLNENELISVVAENLLVLSLDGRVLVGPLNFCIPLGYRTVLVGPSGSGKSSLLNTLSGFLPYNGSLRINNIELSKLNLNSWRKIISWMGQNPQLFATTLKENILIAYPKASEEELKIVLEKTWVNEFLPLLPNGINSLINDQGTGLSTGQIQRIAIARALLKPCKLLILDEPTASLDSYVERQVMSSLNKASIMQTTLMATHQLCSISEWDQILVMEKGKIVEQGSYLTLCKMQGVFFKMLTSNHQKKA